MSLLLTVLVVLLGGVGVWETRKDVPVEPRGVSHWQSVMLWAAALLAVYSIGRWIGDACPEWLYCGGVRTAYLLMAPLMAIAVGAALFRPFVRHARGTRIAVVGVLVGLLLNLATALFVGDNLAYQGERLPWGYVMDAKQQARLFPANATDFVIAGRSSFFDVHVVWTCRVSQADFQAFWRKNGYAFRLKSMISTETEAEDEDEEENGDFCDSSGAFGAAPPAKPFYEHADVRFNSLDCHGSNMLYSVPEQKLYGWFH